MSTSFHVSVTHSSPPSRTMAWRNAGRSGVAFTRSRNRCPTLWARFSSTDWSTGSSAGAWIWGEAVSIGSVLVIGGVVRESCHRWGTEGNGLLPASCFRDARAGRHGSGVPPRGVGGVDDADREPRHDHRGPAVGHERQRQAGDRRAGRGSSRRSGRPGPPARPRPRPRRAGRRAPRSAPPPAGRAATTKHEEEEQPGGPDEPQLLPRHREDEVVELVGHRAVLGPLARHEPLPPHSHRCRWPSAPSGSGSRCPAGRRRGRRTR